MACYGEVRDGGNISLGRWEGWGKGGNFIRGMVLLGSISLLEDFLGFQVVNIALYIAITFIISISFQKKYIKKKPLKLAFFKKILLLILYHHDIIFYYKEFIVN